MNILSSDKKNGHAVLSDFVAFDSETSKVFSDENPEQNKGWVYLWCVKFDGQLRYGRTPTDFLDFLDEVKQQYKLQKDRVHVVIYVHNLSYDIQYFKQFLIARYGTDFKMLATDNHKFITFSIDCFDFRCSYFLSNRSLAKWATDLQVEHQKQVGEIDYQEVHYQDEVLSDEQYHYMSYDVLTLYDCVVSQMNLFHDNLQSVPLTSTGYVRRTTRTECHKNKYWHSDFLKTKLFSRAYVLARKEFAGALTHGNRFYKGKTVKGVIRHRDFRSHYPSQMRARLDAFPVGKPVLYYDSLRCHKDYTLADLDNLSKKHCYLCEIAIRNAKLKDGVTLPYLQYCKCADGKLSDWQRPITDNGRILQMRGSCQIVVNDIDLEILREQYTFEYDIMTIITFQRGAIPDYLKNTIDVFMLGKTKYKDLYKQNPTHDNGVSLMTNKSLLNAIYGMTATNPVRNDFSMDAFGVWSNTLLTPELLETKLEEYYNNFSSFLPYQIGIYVTALARQELIFVVSNLIGYDNFLYADTDSAFYISTPEIEERIEQYNEMKRLESIANGSFIDYNGKIVHYDCFELENEEITEFRFLHAKCYGYNTGDGKLHIVVAGVPTIGTDGQTRESELGTLDNMVDGFVFRNCGGTRAVYIESQPHSEEIHGHCVELASSCLIVDVTKTLHEEFGEVEDFLL